MNEHADTSGVIPRIDLQALRGSDPAALDAMRVAATDVGFATVYNTALPSAQVSHVIETYRAFFQDSILIIALNSGQLREIPSNFPQFRSIPGLKPL